MTSGHPYESRARRESCQKCGGLLVVERVLDYYGPLAGMKCLNCGWMRRAPRPEAWPQRRIHLSRVPRATTFERR